MREYTTPAIILRREVRGECDERISFFSRGLGKMTARTVSSRKILSKLSPHLEPGNLATLRLIEKNDLSIVDALKEKNLAWQLSNVFHLNNLLSENDTDPELWHLLSGTPSWKKILRILGWDPQEASCEECSGTAPRYFDTRTQHFLCSDCYANFPEKATIISIE
ncbi:MAG: recombination protein O N-terminal domain-containing protein [Patescibacteria group bacterium]